MIALVTSHKGMGKICQYQVTFDDGTICNFFVSYGVSKRDIMHHKLADSGMIMAWRSDNNAKALIEDYESDSPWQLSIKYMKKTWG